jgi:hypothetical protein
MHATRQEIRQTFTNESDARMFLAKCMARRDCNMYPIQRREYVNKQTSRALVYYEVYGIKYAIEITNTDY